MEQHDHLTALFRFVALYGITHADIASHLGVSVALVNSWSVGRRQITYVRLGQLLDYVLPHMMAALPTRFTSDAQALEHLRTVRDLVQEILLQVRPVHRAIEKSCQQIARYANRPSDTWSPEDLATITEATSTLTKGLRQAQTHALLPGVDVSQALTQAIQAITELIHALETRVQREETPPHA
jgi:hypothetical protein